MEAEGPLVASVYFKNEKPKKTYIKSRKSVKFWKCLNTNPIGNKSFKHEKTVWFQLTKKLYFEYF